MGKKCYKVRALYIPSLWLTFAILFDCIRLIKNANVNVLVDFKSQARAAGLDPLQRSIKRTSLCRLRRLSEASEAKKKEEEEKRRIVGIRRAKVPLMVYSCGGFTRCFR